MFDLDISIYPTYETERLYLRPTNLSDAAFLLELMNTPAWLANIGDRKVRTLQAASDYIRQRMWPQLAERGYSNNTVVRKADGVRLGTCGIYHRDGLDTVDIGFAFLPNYWKMGYAYEASQHVMDVGRRVYGLTRIGAITTEKNLPSQRLLEKLGLTYRRILHLPNDPEPLRYYEWEKHAE